MPRLPDGRWVGAEAYEDWEHQKGLLEEERVAGTQPLYADYDVTAWKKKLVDVRTEYMAHLKRLKGAGEEDAQAFMCCAKKFGWKFSAKYLRAASARARRAYDKLVAERKI